MRTIETDVLVVGAGPTGLTTSLLASRLGLSSLLVERRDGPQRAPAAHCVNARSFEIWRQAGVDMDAVFALAKDPCDAGQVYWVPRLGGEILGSLPYERQGDEILELTPTPLRNISQHRLEPVLVSQLKAVADMEPQYQHCWEDSVQDADGVTSTVRNLADDETFLVRSRYVIAADGAGSPVRKSLNIACVGPDRIQSFLMIHFEANLRSIVGEHPGVLYWVSDPSCSGTFVAHDIDREWVFMQAWEPENEAIQTFDDARCEDIVRRAMDGAQDVPIRICKAAPWVMTSQIAERYREGRIFLAGDSAHRFPPSGGLGLNTGVQDAHNLVWKLALLEKGKVSDAILDTYESERRPIASYNADQSLSNAMRMMEIPIAMRTAEEPELAAKNFAEMLVSSDLRQQLSVAIANQAEHFDMLGLQLGYCYQGELMTGDPGSAPVVENPVREFVPSSRPGSRLPHGWIETDGVRASTLDLVGLEGFTLFAAADSGWREAAKEFPAPIRVVEWRRDVRDPDNWWHRVAQLSDGGALLIRPDQHVAARYGCAAAKVESRLADALAGVIR